MLLVVLVVHLSVSEYGAAASEMVLKSLPFYEKLGSLLPRTREGNLDVLRIRREGGGGGGGSSSEEDAVRLCHVVDLNRHSAGYATQAPIRGSIALKRVGAVALALEHLNSGNGVVVKEVAGLNERCGVRFTSEFLNTAGLENHAARQVVEVLSRRTGNTTTSTVSTTYQPQPCAFLGAWRSAVTAAMALLTSIAQYPQLSAASQSDRLGDRELFPLLARMKPGTAVSAGPLVELLADQFQLTHVAAVYTDDSFGVAYLSAFKDEAAARGVEVASVGFADDAKNFTSTVRALKDTRYGFFVALVRGLHHEGLMKEALRQGIAGTGGEHNWVATTTVAPLINDFEELRRSSRGVLQFSAIGSLRHIGRYDQYYEAWRELGKSEDDLRFLQSKLPISEGGLAFESPLFTAQTFEDDDEFASTALFYDAAIALGLGACSALHREEGAAAASAGPAVLDGQLHYQSAISASFVGASGTVHFDPKTGSREASSALYVLQNFVADDDNASASAQSSDPIRLREVRAKYYDGGWVSVEPILFGDGTSRLPRSLPPSEVNMNYIGTPLRAVGLALAGIALCLALVCSTWTHLYRKDRVVLSSQPLFLHMVCAGAFLAGSSIVPLSVDDQIAGRGEAGAGAACVAFPWLFSVGWATAFGALFVKTRRVVRIFNEPRFRRVTVKAKDVALPMVLLLGSNTILLSIWTGLAMPFDDMWERTVADYDVFGRPSTSHGSCDWSKGQPDLLITLLVIDLGALLFAIQQAWFARKLSLEYAESEWIARALCMMMITAFVGIPLLIISKDNPSASFFTLTAIIFVTCTSLLVFIFLPKMHYRCKREKEQRDRAALSSSVEQSSTFFPSRSSFTQRFHGIGSSGFFPDASNRSSMSDGQGALVIDHPRMKEYLEQKLEKLSAENGTLRAKVQYHEELQRLRQRSYNGNIIDAASASSEETTEKELQRLRQRSINGNSINAASVNAKKNIEQSFDGGLVSESSSSSAAAASPPPEIELLPAPATATTPQGNSDFEDSQYRAASPGPPSPREQSSSSTLIATNNNCNNTFFI